MEFQDFQAIRKEYEDRGIEFEQLSNSPFQQLEHWLHEANQNSPGPWFETNAMALATADSSGQVSVRYVLLKGISDHEIRFYTNYESLKGQQLAENPRCSVALHWPFMGRQIRICGIATKISRIDSEKYFHSRPRSAQLGAAASNQSQLLESRESLEKRMRQLEADLQDQPIPLPDCWGGYSIQPEQFEFWQGRTSRLHDRVIYELSEKASWTIQRLAP